jgi:GDSL-like Lipase/Acylhydrolase family
MKPILFATAAAAAAFFLGCSNQAGTGQAKGSGGTTSGGGGSSATGGSSAMGGNLASGGNSATGGTTAVGGSSSTGGTTATGGSSGTGGNSATGGRAGSGGTMASGGSAGTSAGGSTSQGGTTSTGGGSGLGGSSGAGGNTAADGGLRDAPPRADGATERANPAEVGPEAGGDVSSAGDAATYQPCPSSPCKILPLGDSITFGVNDEGNAGYRGPLFASAVAAGKKITFTGSLSNGPSTVSGATFPKNNEGHSGWGISEVTPYSGGNAGIATVIPSPALSSGSGGTPNIILLHIGTNDQGSFPATQMTSDLTGLIDKVITNAPNALLVVAQIIPLGYGTNDVIKTYNQSIPAIVQARAAAGKHIMLVDMYTGFTASSMLGSDNIHPNSTGYKFMADHWYSAIGSLLPQ